MANHNILIVHAHPADFACDAAATMALHAERGDRVTSLVVSHGERHHMQWLHDQKLMPPEKRDPDLGELNLTNYREFKKRETERIAEVLGISELIMLGWVDGQIYFEQEKIEQIAEVIRKVKPDIFITRLPNVLSESTHDDHPETARIALKGLRHAQDRVMEFDGVESYRGVKQVFHSLAGGEELNNNGMLQPGITPDVWIDTSSVIEKKVHAIDQLVSQGYHGQTARRIVEARDGRWGMIAGAAYAEPFIRPFGLIYDSLPMSPRSLSDAYQPTHKDFIDTPVNKMPSATPENAYKLIP